MAETPMEPDRANSPNPDSSTASKNERFEPGRIIRRTDGDFERVSDTGAYWREAGIPLRHAKVIRHRHDAQGPWAEKYRKLKATLAEGPIICLLGKRGTGKTQMAVDLLADVCAAGNPVRYLLAMDLFRLIRSCYRNDGPGETELVDEICSLGLLVIDESQERSDSEWENRTMTNIVDRRYAALKPTILISNLSRPQFAEAIGPSIASRVQEIGRIVNCNWESFREQAD